MMENDEERKEEIEEYYGVLHAPYVKDFSEKIQRELKNSMLVGC